MSRRQRAALAVTIAAGGMLLFAQAVTLPTAWLPLEEAPVLAGARGDESPGSLSAGLLYPALVAPAARTLSAFAAHRLAQALSAALWAAIALPAYLLARRLVPPNASLVVAALSMIVPASVYAVAAVPDALALLLAVSSLALLARASARGSRPELFGALALAVAAALARPWLAVLPLALLAAYVLPRARWRSLLHWPMPLAVTPLAGIAYLGLARWAPDSAIALASLGTPARAAVASFAVAAVGLGVVPWLLAPAAARPERALLVACFPALVLAAGVLGTLQPGRGLDERPLLVLAPLVLALAARAWLDRSFRLGEAVLAGVLVALAALALPPLGRVPAARAAGLSVVSPEGGSRAYLAGAVVAAGVVALLLLVVLRRRVVLLPVALALLLLVGQAAAWSTVRAEARTLAAGEPAPPGWVDRNAGAGARVVIVGPADALDPLAVAQLRLWNRSVSGVQALSFIEVDPHSGQLGVAPDADLVFVRGTELVGTEIARSAGGVLVRPPGPLNLAETVEGVFTDGWSGEQAVYRRFTGSPGTVLVTIGRPDGPPAEAWVEVGRGEESAVELRSRIALASGEERELVIEVPRPQFRVAVRVSPTFPAPDGRQLGAQVRFEYRARR
jgi:hypothetical protein